MDALKPWDTVSVNVSNWFIQTAIYSDPLVCSVVSPQWTFIHFVSLTFYGVRQNSGSKKHILLQIKWRISLFAI